MSSQIARPEQPIERDEASRTTDGSGSASAPKSREPASAMAVNDPGFGSSADGKGEEGIDRSFERTGTPLYLCE
jgi:hypothetical protein